MFLFASFLFNNYQILQRIFSSWCVLLIATSSSLIQAQVSFLFPFSLNFYILRPMIYSEFFGIKTSLLFQALASYLWKLSKIHCHIWELIIVSCYLIFLNIFRVWKASFIILMCLPISISHFRHVKGFYKWSLYCEALYWLSHYLVIGD